MKTTTMLLLTLAAAGSFAAGSKVIDPNTPSNSQVSSPSTKKKAKIQSQKPRTPPRPEVENTWQCLACGRG